jgi:hypothetical protein
MTEPAEDLRSGLQKKEQAEAAAHAKLPKAEQVARRLDALIKSLDHQVKHNAPIGPALVSEIKSIRALIG